MRWREDDMTDLLLLIALQQAIFAGRGGTDQAGAEMRLDALCSRLSKLGRRWLESGLPIIAVQHSGPTGHRLERGSAGWALRPEIAEIAAAATAVIEKAHCDSFVGTGLHDLLGSLGVKRLVVGGCMTEFCIDTCCRSAIFLGYDVVLLSDGHETVDGIVPADAIRRHHNATLDGLTSPLGMLTLSRCEQMCSPDRPDERRTGGSSDTGARQERRVRIGPPAWGECR